MNKLQRIVLSAGVTLFCTASLFPICGCMANRLTSVHGMGHGWFGYKRADYPHTFSASKDPSEDFDEFYRKNIEKLNGHSASGALPEMPYGEYNVCCADITDDKCPLKMVAYNSDDKSWRLILYYTEISGGRRILSTGDYQLKDGYKDKLRAFVLKYLKESENPQCVEWRTWAASKEYVELAKKPPVVHLSTMNGFADSLYAEYGFVKTMPNLIHPIAGDLDAMVEKGLLNRNGHPLPKQLINDRALFGRLFDQFQKLTKLVNNEQGRVYAVIEEINQELLKKRLAKKSEIDEQRRVADEKARKERERIAEEKRVAEENRKRKEAADLKRKQDADSAVMKQIEFKVAAWKNAHAADIEKMCSAPDPIVALVSFVRECKFPRVNDLVDSLQLSENKLRVIDLATMSDKLSNFDWDGFVVKSARERVKHANELRDICEGIDAKIWASISKYCAGVEQQSADEALYLALKSGDDDAVSVAIKDHTSSFDRIFIVDGANKWTPLTYAAMKGNCNALKQLVAKGANVNFVDGVNNTPIGQASWSGQVNAIRELISLGARIKNSPLSAARNGQLDAVKFYVEEADVSVNAFYDGYGFLLGEAARFGQEKVFKYLVEKGCDVNLRPSSKKCGYYYSALETAVICTNKVLLAYLKDSGRVSEFYDAKSLAQKLGDESVLAFINEWEHEYERKLQGLCGLKFGDIDAGGTPIVLGGDKGLMTRQFVPQKRFDDFDEYYCLSTPKSHRICKIYIVKSVLIGWGGSPDQLDESLRQKYKAIKPILERKYLFRCIRSYPWTMEDKKTGRKQDVGIGFKFPNGVVDFSIADKKDMEDLYGGFAWTGRALLIVATDTNLYKLGKQEAEEMEKEKVSDSADAL